MEYRIEHTKWEYLKTGVLCARTPRQLLAGRAASLHFAFGICSVYVRSEFSMCEAPSELQSWILCACVCVRERTEPNRERTALCVCLNGVCRQLSALARLYGELWRELVSRTVKKSSTEECCRLKTKTNHRLANFPLRRSSRFSGSDSENPHLRITLYSRGIKKKKASIALPPPAWLPERRWLLAKALSASCQDRQPKTFYLCVCV